LETGNSKNENRNSKNDMHRMRRKGKKAALTTALPEHVRRHKQLEVASLFGTIDYDPEYDYKAERRRRPASRISRWVRR
jgi:hypothetical protein